MGKVTKTALDYNSGTNTVPKGSFRISASGVSRFFTNTNSWWRENMLGEAGFTGSNASIIGTCTHYYGEQFAKNGEVSEDDLALVVL